VQTLSVSLLVTSSSLSLAELTSRLGRPPSVGSHSRGDAHAGAKLGKAPWAESIWRFDSDAAESAPLQEHLERLQVQFPPQELLRALPSGCELCVDVAVFFDTANVGVAVSRKALEIVLRYQADLEISCYPSDFEPSVR
jgi:hypothetical protein